MWAIVVAMLATGCVTTETEYRSAADGSPQLYLRHINGRNAVAVGNTFEVVAPADQSVQFILNTAQQVATARKCVAAVDRGSFYIPRGVPHPQSPLGHGLAPELANRDVVAWEFFCVNPHFGFKLPMGGYIVGRENHEVTDTLKDAVSDECRLANDTGTRIAAMACYSSQGGMVGFASIPYLTNHFHGRPPFLWPEVNDLTQFPEDTHPNAEGETLGIVPAPPAAATGGSNSNP